MNLIIALLAVCPSLLLLIYVKNKGKATDKPFNVLLFMALGGILICPFAYVFETVFDYALISLFYNSYSIYNVLSCFLEAGFIEELLKLLVFAYLSSKYEKYYKTMFDGILFSVCVSLGFAVFENLLYVFVYSYNGLETAFLRAITPGHFCFSIFMGLFFSEAKKYEQYDETKYNSFILLSLFIPTLIHGLYDYCLTVGNTMSLMLFIVLLFSLYCFAFITIKKKSEGIFFL